MNFVFNPLGPPFDYSLVGTGTGIVNSLTATAPLTANGVSGVAQTGDVTIAILPMATSYTNVNSAMSPYTVLSTDSYISVDCSAGAVTLNFPNSPTPLQEWVVKDRLGFADTHHVTITTPGGTVTFDEGTSYTLDDMYESVQLIANPSFEYEIF